jgi:hypothetical protein
MDKNLFSAENIKSFGVAGLLALIVWASFSGQFVWSSQYKEAQAATTAMKEERDKWMKVALEGTRLSEVAAHEVARTSGNPFAPLAPPEINSSKPLTPEVVASKLEKVSQTIEPGIEREPVLK